jgi:plasmid stabilization system protein ParE
MPRGDKGAYTDKQKRKAEHIEEGYEKRGVSKKEAEARAWATVNKDSGGGNKSGSGRGKKDTNASARARREESRPEPRRPLCRSEEGLGNAAEEGQWLTR